MTRFSSEQVAELIGAKMPTAEQSAIIEAPASPMVVVAGAGAGKTETIATRVVWLVANGHVEPGQVLGLTFTRKAAGELGSRIRSRLRRFLFATDQQDLLATEPVVSTYAAYAGGLVDEHGLRLGFEPGARLLGAAARWQLAWDVVTRYEGELHEEIGTPRTVTRYVLGLADEMAGHLVGAEDIARFTERLGTRLPGLQDASRSANSVAPASSAGYAKPVCDLWRRAQDRLALTMLVRQFQIRKAQDSGADFGDRMRAAAQLADLPAVQSVERARYRVVLLDEYQDTSYAESRLLALLFGDGRPVTAVGDPLQAIYGWRGASASNMSSFPGVFRDTAGSPARRYGLSTSWRNDHAVLAAANAVAGPARIALGALPSLTLGARPGAGPGSVVLALHGTLEAEADWVAAGVAEKWFGKTGWTDGAPSAAILVRARTSIPTLVAACRRRGLPVEVLNLGGLLALPEVLDVTSTLRVLVDAQAGAGLTRLLTGSRWRLAPADLVALSRRAAALARQECQPGPDHRSGWRAEPQLIAALHSLGSPAAYSAPGYRRMSRLRDELVGLSRRLDQPLTDLIEDIASTSGLAAELALRGPDGRANLDRLIAEAGQFDAGPTASIASFLSYLDAAREQEHGLEIVESRIDRERVQILTVHGAKGLEWDVVAIAGLSQNSFPATPKGDSWLTDRSRLPHELRGDADGLPAFTLVGAATPKDANRAVAAYQAALAEHRLAEERRLAYVAMTRARRVLLCSGATWATGTNPRPPSPFLQEVTVLADAATAGISVSTWHEPDPAQCNPRLNDVSEVFWPADPFTPDGRRRIDTAADLVRGLRGGQLAGSPSMLNRTPWTDEADLLLAERDSQLAPAVITVRLPDRMTASDAVAVASDPARFARRLRRPMPARPSAAALRGTAFHEWIEARFHSQGLFDIDEVADIQDRDTDRGEPQDGPRLEQLKRSFESGQWSARTPIAVEVSFEMPFAGTVLRGRMDAVFADGPGRYTVIDWKTGSPPTGDGNRAMAVQLAVYRLAWARLNGIGDSELDRVKAACYFVETDTTVFPAEIPGAEQLARLVRGASADESAGSSDSAGKHMPRATPEQNMRSLCE
jgi:DNA helicase-2/ATP-dependent DNA helicase PcrA